MASTRSFSQMSFACLKTWSTGKTSRYLYSGRAGHLRFIGGILEAQMRRFSRLASRETISPRRPSLFPSPYAQAVSKNVQPESTASWMAPSDSASSEPLHPPMPQRPWAMSLAEKPVRPKRRYLMARQYNGIAAAVAERPVIRKNGAQDRAVLIES